LSALTTRWQQQRDVAEGTLIIRAVPNRMLFAPTEVHAKAGQVLRLTLENPDLMAHNLVLCAPDSGEEVGALADRMATMPDGMARHFIPASPHVLGAIPLLEPGGSGTLTLKAPLAPGRYPYLCTFPGHWRIMRGVLIVE
jgi:azurin